MTYLFNGFIMHDELLLNILSFIFFVWIACTFCKRIVVIYFMIVFY